MARPVVLPEWGTDRWLLKSSLYARQGDGRVVLKGARCQCGYIFFPPQRYGCEMCGRTDPKSILLRGLGVLVASAMVHVHSRPGRIAPFAVGTIRLVDGPLVRSVLTGALDDLTPGRTMVASLVALPACAVTERMWDVRFKMAAKSRRFDDPE